MRGALLLLVAVALLIAAPGQYENSGAVSASGYGYQEAYKLEMAENTKSDAKVYNDSIVQLRERLKEMREVALQTRKRIKNQLQIWKEIREKYVNGSIDVEAYFNATWQLMKVALNVSLERAREIDATDLEEQLINLETQLDNAEDLEDLKELYPTLRSLYREVLWNMEDKYPEEVAKLLDELDQLEKNFDSLTAREIVQSLKEIRAQILALY